ncbi:MAG: hypothetical protein GY872_07310, partial [Roseibacillus sp.]|nr:hypothetical protein [Roseibacillus sp.]
MKTLISILIAIGVTSFNSLAEFEVTEGLVAHYPFNGNGNDESGNGNHGVVENIEFRDSQFGPRGQYAFLGSDSSDRSGLSISSAPSLQLPASGYTLAGWVKGSDFSSAPPSNAYFTLIASQGINGAQEDAYNLRYSGHGLNFQCSSGDLLGGDPGYRNVKFSTTDPATTFLSDNQWYHIAVTYDGSSFKGFVDGVELTAWGNTALDHVAPKFTGRDTAVGKRADGSGGVGYDPHSNGGIDEVRIYNRGLSNTEITALYELEKPTQSTSTFEIVAGNFTWEQARADAEARGGRLAVLDTPAQVDGAYSYLEGVGTWPFLWLGASDAETEDVWVWLNGEPLEDSNPRWKGEEGPTNHNNNPDAEDYLVMFSSDSGTNAGLWGDGVNQQAYLLEIPASTLTEGLVAHYPFNGNADDESGNGNNGT